MTCVLMSWEEGGHGDPVSWIACPAIHICGPDAINISSPFILQSVLAWVIISVILPILWVGPSGSTEP